MMTHKDRIERTLGRKEIDRPAISAWRHFYHRENTTGDLATAMVDFQRQFDWDFMKINPRASYHVEGWGAKFQYSNDPLVKPKTLSLPVARKADWEKVRPLDWNAGSLGEILTATGDIVKQIGHEIHCVQTVFSPLSVAADLVENEPRFVELLHEGPGELHGALEAITETFIGFVKTLMKSGVSGIFFATTEWASRDLLTEEEYLEFGRPYDLKILRAGSGAMFNVVHVCGKNNMLPLFRDYPAPVVSWNPFEMGNLSVHQAAQIIDRIFLTGVDQKETLLNGPADAIKKQIEESLRDAPSGRLMVGPGCAISVSTPDENLRTAIETVKGFQYD